MTNKLKQMGIFTFLAIGADCSLGDAPVTQLKMMSFNIWVNSGQGLNQCIDAISTRPASAKS